jgi:biopolymer transport protein ExbB
MSIIEDILKFFALGGWLMWPIFGVSLVVWYIGAFKLYEFWCLTRARRRFMASLDDVIIKKNVARIGDNNYDRLISSLLRFDCITPGIFKGIFKEFLQGVIPHTNRGVDTIAAWISVAPLLGLLGTVVGMVETFRVITVFGVGNPALTAEGISIALLTTEAGLTAAFPGLLLFNFVNNRKKKLQKQLLLDGEKIYNIIAR